MAAFNKTANAQVIYDFDRFDERKASSLQQKPSRLPRRRAASGVSFQSIATFAVVIATLAVMLMGYVVQTENNRDISSMKTELAQLQDEGRRLEMEVEKLTSLKNVEQYARSTLGMNEIQSYQVEYVSLNNSDKAVILQKNDGVALADIISSVARALSTATEYIK